MRRLLFVLALAHPPCDAFAQLVVHGEYWIDEDLGFGENQSFLVPATADTTLTLNLDLSGHPPGHHLLGLRTRDAGGRWGHTQFTPVLITEAPSVPDLDRTEVFLNNDPGFGAGEVLWAGSVQDVADTIVLPDLSTALIGHNTLFLRTRSADGHWGHTNTVPVLVIPAPSTAAVDAVEAFVVDGGPDPGFGQAQPFTGFIAAVDLVDTLTSDAPFALTTGQRLALRSHDDQGRWGHTNFIDSIVVEFHNDLGSLWNAVGLSVHPNPFTETLTMRSDDPRPVRVVLYGPTGGKVFDRMLTGGSSIDLHGMASGAYTAFFWQEAALLHRVTLIKR